MTLTANSICLRKRRQILIPDGNDDSTQSAASFNRNLESLGFTLSREAFDRLVKLTPTAIVNLYEEVVPVLKEMVGGHRRFRPMYPGFPLQVIQTDEVELYLNALLHYWLSSEDVVALPYSENMPRPSLDEPGSIKQIGLGTRQGFESIFTSLVGVNSSLSEEDKGVVKWFVENYRENVDAILPAAIPQKETLALLVGSLLGVGEKMPVSVFDSIKTATDVLRVMSVMSGGDVSLAENAKFKSFSKKSRRFFLSVLDGMNATEDMLRRPEVWKRVGEKLHPGQYRSRFPKAYSSFEVIRHNLPFQTFNGKVERLLKNGDVIATSRELGSRPGDFARRLDHLLRLSGPEADDVALAFLEVAEKVSTPVLFQAFAHFKGREKKSDTRTFFPKGNVGKMQVVENDLIPIRPNVTRAVASGIRSVLSERFSHLPPLGNVYIEPSLANHPIPFAKRSASKSLRTLTRGAKIALPEGDTIRMFLWWKNGGGRTDIDLSACLFDENWKRVADLAYYNLRDFGCHHSGDIISAPKGASEFIDVHIPSVLKKNCCYMAMCLNSYTQQPYCDLPECFAGWMARSSPNSGEIFEPKTVIDKVDLTADTTVAIPVFMDLVNRQAIWADVALKGREFINNVDRNRDNITRLGKALTNLNRATLYQLFSFHALGRGELVSSKGEADVVFSEHEGITPFDTDRILSEFLV